MIELSLLGEVATFVYDEYGNSKTSDALRRLQESVDAHTSGLQQLSGQVEWLASAPLRMGLEDLRRSVSPNTAPADRDRIREQAADRCAEAAHSSADLDTQVVSALWCATAHALRGHLHDAAYWSGNARTWACAAFDEAIAAKPPELPPHRTGLADWIGNLLFDDYPYGLPPSEVHHRGKWLEGRFPQVEQLLDMKSIAAAYDAALRGQPAPPEVRVLPLPAGASSMSERDKHDFGELALFDVLEEGSVFEVDAFVGPNSADEPKKEPASVSVTSAFFRPRRDETDSRTRDLFVGFTVHRAADVEASKVGATSAERGLSWYRWTPLYEAGYTTFSEPSVTLRFEVRDRNGTGEDPRGVAVVAQAGTRRVWVPVGPAARVGEDHPLPEDLLNPWSPPLPERKQEPDPDYEPYDGPHGYELWDQWFRQ